MALDSAALEALAVAYLKRQPWYLAAHRHGSPGDPDAPRPRLVELETLAGLPAGLARLLVAAGGQHFQILVGWRAATESALVLRGREGSLLGPLRDGEEEVLAYDALADDELTLRLLEVVSGGAEHAERVRPVNSLVSHASLVFDERLFMKCYRVLRPGARPEIELLYRLDDVGFNAMLAPVARWQASGFDLALVREFVANGIEGRELALTSLRDLLAHAVTGAHVAAPASVAPGEPVATAQGEEVAALGALEEDGGPLLTGAADRALPPPSQEALENAASAGGDLASESYRLGTTTANMHVALATAFGERPATSDELAARLEPLGSVLPKAPSRRLGSRIRLHGDYHLRRVMRSEAGWLVAGFGDDPLYGDPRYGHEVADASLSRHEGSPLEDLADLYFSLRRIALEAVASRPQAEAPAALDLASAWVWRNREAFTAGYRVVPAAASLLPLDPAIGRFLLDAFVELRVKRYEAAPAAD